MRVKNFLISFIVVGSLLPLLALADTTNTVLYKVVVNKNVTALNERSGPGLQYDHVGQLTAGETESVYAEDNGWLKVSTGDSWVDGSYVTKEANAALYQATVNTNVSSLNERSGPAATYGRVGSLTAGNVVSVYAEDNGWLKVSSSNTWVDGQYVTKGTTKTSSASASSQTATANVALYQATVNANVSSLNERSGPAATYGRVGSLTAGNVVSVYAEDNGWLKVSSSNTWVDGQYVTKGAAAKPAVHISSTVNQSAPASESKEPSDVPESAAVVSGDPGTETTPAYMAAIKRANADCRVLAVGCTSYSKTPHCVAANQKCEAEQQAAFTLLKPAK